MNAEQTLNQWNQEFETVRTNMRRGGSGPGIASPAQFANKSGLEVMQA